MKLKKYYLSDKMIVVRKNIAEKEKPILKY